MTAPRLEARSRRRCRRGRRRAGRPGHRLAPAPAGPAVPGAGGAAELGHSWRSRWDSLRLFTPAAVRRACPACRSRRRPTPTRARSAVADYLQAYAAAFDLPVELNARVTALQPHRRRLPGQHRRPDVHRPAGGRGHRTVPDPVRPTGGRRAGRLGDPDAQRRLPQPAGPARRTGAGRRRRQLRPPDRRGAGRAPGRSTLSVGSTNPPTLPQRLLGRDLFWWLTRLGLMRVTGRAPGSAAGCRPAASSSSAPAGAACSGPASASGRGWSTPTGARSGSPTAAAARSTSCVWATGYRPGLLLDRRPRRAARRPRRHRRGVTDVPGLYFLGLSWQHTRGSALLGFVADDASHIADRVAADRTATASDEAPTAPQASD